MPWVGFRLATVYAVAVHADLLETVGRNRAVRALIGCVPVRSGLGVPCAPRMSRNGGTATRFLDGPSFRLETQLFKSSWHRPSATSPWTSD